MGKYTAQLLILWYNTFGENQTPPAEEWHGCHSKNCDQMC